MVCAAMSSQGRTPLAFIGNIMNSEAYANMLDNSLLPIIAEYYPHGASFQQENAPFYSAKHAPDFFADSEITDLYWTLRSPGMNCIESC